MKTINLAMEPRDAVLARLLRVACTFCTHASLVVREEASADATLGNTLRSFEPWLERDSWTASWPGTELLFGARARMYVYRLDSAFSDALMRNVRGLFDWVHPSLPEDLCTYRADGSVWLASIAHERDAFLEVSSQEEDTLRNDPVLGEVLAS